MRSLTGGITGDVFQWIGGALLAAVLSLAAVRCMLGFVPWFEMTAGWGVAVLNAAGAFLINRASVGPADQKLPLKGLFLNIIRVFILLGVLVVAFERLGKQGFCPFLVAMFSGYFVFLIGEIARLHRSVLKGPTSHE